MLCCVRWFRTSLTDDGERRLAPLPARCNLVRFLKTSFLNLGKKAWVELHSLFGSQSREPFS